MIRKAHQNDIPSLLRLLSQVLSIHANGRPDIFKSGTTKYTNDELLSILKNDTTPIFVATDETGAVRGYAFCQRIEIKGDNILQDLSYMYIDDLCVDEHYRRTGIGAALYEYVVEQAKALGCHSIRLNVWNLNQSALHFYEKHGLQALKTTMEYKI